MLRGRQTDLPKWLRSKHHGDKAFKNVQAAGRVFMLEFRVSRPLDIPRAHMALLFDFSGSCRTKKDGLFDYVAGTLVHVVVEDYKSRHTKLEIRHVSSDDRSRLLNLSAINRVYLLGKLAHRPLNPFDFFQSVSVELEAIYLGMVESEDSLSEGEFPVVKRQEHREEKRYYRHPEQQHSRQSTPSMSLTDSGNIVWRVSDPHGKDAWYSTKDIKPEKRPALKDSTQSIILTYVPAQRDEIRKVGALTHTISTESFSYTGKSTETVHVEDNLDLLTLSHSEHPSHGPYWDNKLNCMSFCKKVCQHWSDLKWPTEGLCAPIMWPLASLNPHLKLGYTPNPSMTAGPENQNQTNPPSTPPNTSHPKLGNHPDVADQQSSNAKVKSPSGTKKQNFLKRIFKSISRRLRRLFSR